ncbi:MAG: hypothetical protein ACLP6G_19085 [Terriglobales bacterium]
MTTDKQIKKEIERQQRLRQWLDESRFDLELFIESCPNLKNSLWYESPVLTRMRFELHTCTANTLTGFKRWAKKYLQHADAELGRHADLRTEIKRNLNYRAIANPTLFPASVVPFVARPHPTFPDVLCIDVVDAKGKAHVWLIDAMNEAKAELWWKGGRIEVNYTYDGTAHLVKMCQKQQRSGTWDETAERLDDGRWFDRPLKELCFENGNLLDYRKMNVTFHGGPQPRLTSLDESRATADWVPVQPKRPKGASVHTEEIATTSLLVSAIRAKWLPSKKK